MKTNQENSNVEKRIDSGLLGLCILFFVGVVGVLIETLFVRNIKNQSVFFSILFTLAFGLHAFLRRIRPSQQNAGAGWNRLYIFILKQMDIGNAFRRR